jgi:hypothetical protein
MEQTFIVLRGKNGKAITINSNSLIKFERGDNCTLVYTANNGILSRQSVAISYDALQTLVKE